MVLFTLFTSNMNKSESEEEKRRRCKRTKTEDYVFCQFGISLASDCTINAQETIKNRWRT